MLAMPLGALIQPHDGDAHVIYDHLAAEILHPPYLRLLRKHLRGTEGGGIPLNFSAPGTARRHTSSAGCAPHPDFCHPRRKQACAFGRTWQICISSSSSMPGRTPSVANVAT
eukprot:1196299-Prorocentrum_minimum.AAC.5